MNRSWRRYLRFWGTHVDGDVDDELAFHVEMRIHDYIARGMSERDARAAAERRFGSRSRVRDRCVTIGHRRQRRMTRAQTIDALAQDVRYALRTLGRQKGWTAVALLTMALGVGASTAVFSAVNGVILNPLPYRDSHRVVSIWRSDTKAGIMITPSDKMLEAWTAQSHAFEAIERYGKDPMTLTGRGDAATLQTASVSPTFPAFAGVGLIAGRMFAAEETVRNGPAVVVIGEQMWRERFGASLNALGQTLTLNDKLYTIIGIAPARLRLPTLDRAEVDVWLPCYKDSLSFQNLTVARLRKGVTRDAATKELEAINEHNHLDEDMGPRTFAVRLVQPGETANVRTSLFLLAGAVALLLLVACANVAHLLLARGATRERELAIRAALGAGRWRLGRQLLTESTLLAFVGCIAGVALAFVGVRALAALRPESLSELAYAELDARALWVALAMSAFAGIAFGCTAALHAVRRTTSDALRASSASGTAAPRTHTLRSLLVVTEMAVSSLLLVGAALLIRSVVKLQQVDPGLDTRNLYEMSVAAPRSRFPESADRWQFIERVVQNAQAVPGVTAVTLGTATPPGIGGVMMAGIEADGGTKVTTPTVMPLNFITPTFFQVLGIRLTGSAFSDASVERGEVIVNRGFAAKYWPGQSAVGRRLRFLGSRNQKPDEGWMTVVGVADDVPTRGLAGDRHEPFLYKPINPKEANSRYVVAVRAKDGIDPVAALRGVVTSIDARLVPPPVSTVESDLAKSIATQRFTMTLLAAFASLAVVLSAIGLYGVISYVVTQRTREIGIRVALGATPRHVARAIVARGLVLSVAGLVLGLTAAVWGTKLIKTALYEVTSTDPASYALAGVTLLAVSVLACLIPMRRAMRVDPVIAMRGD